MKVQFQIILIAAIIMYVSAAIVPGQDKIANPEDGTVTRQARHFGGHGYGGYGYGIGIPVYGGYGYPGFYGGGLGYGYIG